MKLPRLPKPREVLMDLLAGLWSLLQLWKILKSASHLSLSPRNLLLFSLIALLKIIYTLCTFVGHVRFVLEFSSCLSVLWICTEILNAVQMEELNLEMTEGTALEQSALIFN